MVKLTWRRRLGARTEYIALHTSCSQIYPLLHATHGQLSLLSHRVSKVTQFFHPKMNVLRLNYDK